MFRPGSDSFGSSRDAAPVRCAATWIDAGDNWWWLGNWWRISPPAVPIASVRGADS